jgi:hypothetical protein
MMRTSKSMARNVRPKNLKAKKNIETAARKMNA